MNFENRQAFSNNQKLSTKMKAYYPELKIDKIPMIEDYSLKVYILYIRLQIY